MTSELGWIAGTLRERDEAAEFINADHQAEPRDELGIAPLRDVLAQAFFPGVTTQQTRAKYFLFTPLMFVRAEQMRSSRSPEARVLEMERELLNRLLAAGESDGVIGSRYSRVPGRPATSIYWTGLHQWRIRKADIALPRYYNWVRGGRELRRASLSEEEQAIHDETIWDAGLSSHKTVLEDLTMALTKQQAQYLRDRVLSIKNVAMSNGEDKRPLIKDLMQDALTGTPLGGEFWSHPSVSRNRADLAEIARDAGMVSAAMEGAMVVYNYCCARLRRDSREYWEGQCAKWGSDHPRAVWSEWDLSAAFRRFKALPHGEVAARATERFLRDWHRYLSDRSEVAVGASKHSRELIKFREARVKPGRTRLSGGPGLEDWEGTGVGNGQIRFRWSQAERILNDILDPE